MFINEIFQSLLGESTYQGLPCIFIRTAGCNLRCKWCDTKYAYYYGEGMAVPQIIKTVDSYFSRHSAGKLKLVEITGGEPLIQKEVYKLSKELLNSDYKVLIETNGSMPAEKLDKRVIRIMDIKCPGSEMHGQMYWQNFKKLRPTDEIKFVVADRNDYDWAKTIIKKFQLSEQVTLLFSPVQSDYGSKNLATQLAWWILKDKLNARLQLQLHKSLYIK